MAPRLVRLLAAVATLVTGLVIGPVDPATAEDLPVLWSGTQLDTAGAPTAGRVAAFVRPPASAVPKVSVLTPAGQRPALASIPVGGRNALRRKDNSRATFNGSAAIWGFSGGSTVTYGAYSAHSWTNDSVYNRYLCGENGSPATGHTRVRAGN